MSTAMTHHDVFHEGELAVQQRADAVAQGNNSGRMVADTIIPGAIKFVKKQPFAVMGNVDDEQNLWSSVIVGHTGFMMATPDKIDINLSQTLRIDDDPIWQNLVDDPRIGILVIDLRSRARLRVNGRVEFAAEDQMYVHVEQAYPNCPQYIQRRNYRPSINPVTNSRPVRKDGTELNHNQQQWTRISAALNSSQFCVC